MHLSPRIALFAVALLLPAVGHAEGEADAVLGRWSTAEDASQVEISRCGEKLCGKIVSLKEELYPEIDPATGKKDPEVGKPKRDRENPDKKLQSRPILGLQLLEGFSYEGDGEWEDGRVYDPNNGKTYKCSLELDEGGKVLKVRGYIGISLIGRTTEWKRIEAGSAAAK